MLPHNFQDSGMPNVLSRCFWNHPTRLWRKDMTKCLKSRDLHFGELQIWSHSHISILHPPTASTWVWVKGFQTSILKEPTQTQNKSALHHFTPWICEGLWRCEVVTVVFPSKPQLVHVHERLTTVDEWLWLQEHDIFIQHREWRVRLQCKTLKNPFKRIEGIRFL